MPIIEYLRSDGSTFEHIVMHGEEVPEEIDGARRIPSSPGMVKLQTHFHTPAPKLPPGHRVVEPGMMADQKRYKKEREDKWKQEKRKIAEEALRDVRSATVRR